MSGIIKGIILTEDSVLLTETRTYKLWESAGQKLVEAQLTPAQISKLFANIEQNSTAAGDNRTLAGKGKDAASAVGKAWEELKTKVQNSGPIKNVDAMYDQAAEKLKQATGGDQGVMQYVQKYRDFAKKHPVAQSFIYAALIAAAGISGAGAGGAAALGLFKMADKLLQGEKFSSAAYSGAKTGALAYGASKLGDLIKNTFSPVTKSGTLSYNGPGGSVFQATYKDGKVTELILGDKVITPSDPGFTEAVKTWNSLRKAKDAEMTKLGSDVGMSGLGDLGGIPKEIGANESKLYEATTLDVSTIQLLFANIEKNNYRFINEGVLDSIKGAAGKAADWAKTKGHNITTKVTADKLMQAWKKAGSPTESSDIAALLAQNNVPQSVIKQTFRKMRIAMTNKGKKQAAPNPAGLSSKPGINPATGKRFKTPAKKAAPAAAPAPKATSQRGKAKAPAPAAPAPSPKGTPKPSKVKAGTKQAAPKAPAPATGGTLSPAQHMYNIVQQQMRGMDLSQHQTVLNKAVSDYETALKDQINKAGGTFSGKFEGPTQAAVEKLAKLMSSLAASSVSAR